MFQLSSKVTHHCKPHKSNLSPSSLSDLFVNKSRLLSNSHAKYFCLQNIILHMICQLCMLKFIKSYFQLIMHVSINRFDTVFQKKNNNNMNDQLYCSVLIYMIFKVKGEIQFKNSSLFSNVYPNSGDLQWVAVQFKCK